MSDYLAVLTFIDLAERLPQILDERIHKCVSGAATTGVPIPKLTQNNRVTFEEMFRAYRLIFLRDVNSLDEETDGKMRLSGARFAFASKAAFSRTRYRHVMGRCASVIHRLGAIPLTAPYGTAPGTSTGYGKSSLNKALDIMRRDHKDGCRVYDPSFTPSILWRLQI